MIISVKHKFIFIKTRKVAGSSLEKYLIDKLVDKETDIHTGTSTNEYSSNNISRKDGGSVSGHLAIIDIARVLNKNISELVSNYFIFSIERNPFDKCVSAFFFKKYKYESFKTYLYSKKFPKDWNKYTINNNIIGTVYKYENFNKMFKELNLYLNLKSDNLLNLEEFSNYNLKTSHRPKKEIYKKYYDDESRKFVEENFKNEIYRFGYSF